MAETTDMYATAFRITFDCASALRTLTDVLDNMLDVVEFHVVKGAAYEGVTVEAVDSKQISLIGGQLRAAVEMEGSQRTVFCVSAKTFHTCIRNCPNHFTVDISSAARSSTVEIKMYETLSNTAQTRFTLPTLVADGPHGAMEDQEYKIHIDMDTAVFKGIVRMCLSLGGESLQFVVRQLDATSLSKRARTDQKHTVLTISSNGGGSCEQEHTFYSVSQEHDGMSTVSACDELSGGIPADCELEETYRESFGAKHLADFLKSIDRQTVRIRLREGLPLVVHHAFGAEDSYVCLVVAPQVCEE